MIFMIKIESNNNLFETLESMGDFFLVPKTNNIILHTKLSRTKVYNKVKKISIGEFDLSLVDDEEIENYPNLIKSWNNIDKLEDSIKKIDVVELEKEALYKLNLFIDSLEDELKKESDIGKEVINCRMK